MRFLLSKKNETELPKKKLTFFNTNTKKKDFTFYDYVRHLEKFGYEWNKKDFKYEIKIKNKKIEKKTYFGKTTKNRF